MKLVISPLAVSDLESIYDYIAQDSPKAAKQFLSRLKAQFKYIRNHPQIGPVRDHIRQGLHAMPVDHYMIYYMPAPKQVTIIRVLHAARDVEKFNTQP